MKKALFLFALTVIFSSFALADIRLPDTPKPKPVKSIDSTMTIRFDKKAKDATLVISKGQLKQLRAELEQLDNESNTASNTGFTRTQTIVSGLFMSLAMVFGGVWLTRSQKINTKVGKTLIAGAILFCVGSLATIAFANAGPPAELRQITSKLFDKKVFTYWNSAYGKIKIQVSENANGVELIVPEVKEDAKPGDE